MFNGAAALKAGLGEINPKTRRSIPDGIYNVILVDANGDFKFKNPNTEGLVLTYRIDGGEFDGEDVTEYIITKGPTGKEMPWNYSKANLRVQTFGADYATFNWPSKKSPLGDFKTILEAKAALKIKSQPDETGRSRARVVAVFSREEAGSQAA